MSKARRSIKRQKSNTPEIITHTNSIDLSSDLDFLTGCVGAKDVLLLLLLSSRITNSSFSNLYERSEQIGWKWKELFLEERNNLKLDEKSKPKRITFNRLIHACSENPSDFVQQAQKLNEEIECQMSDPISPEGIYYTYLQSLNDVYNEVKAWRLMQCERRLFYKECNGRYSLLTLQRLMTDQFMNIADFLCKNPVSLQFGLPDILIELFAHSLIIVVQPSGTDCVAVTKYEKLGRDFSAKIKTRIICLLDLDIVKQYLDLSDIDVTLYPKNRQIDPEGDRQVPLIWKTRTIMSSENIGRKFHYAELKETDVIKLSKRNSKGKPLYTNGLCQFKFEVKFTVMINRMSTEVPITFDSQLFGLCSHAKYCSKYLAQVFIVEVTQMYRDINLNTHIDTLNGYICELHKRISGVEAKAHTRQFIKENLNEVYTSFHQSAVSLTGPVMIFSLDIYENILEKLFIQIKFLGSYPFLAMMYHDSLFRGICSDAIDQTISENVQGRALMVLRFEIYTRQEKTESTNIIFVINNGTLFKARITHAYLIDDIYKCLYTAAENEQNGAQVFGDNSSLPFWNFRWYYDNGLSRDNLIQADNETIFQPINVLLQSTIRNTPTPIDHQDITHSFNLLGQLTGKMDLTDNAIAFLDEQYRRWCEKRNVRGCLVGFPRQKTTELSNNNDTSTFNEEILDDEIDRLLYEHNL